MEFQNYHIILHDSSFFYIINNLLQRFKVKVSNIIKFRIKLKCALNIPPKRVFSFP